MGSMTATDCPRCPGGNAGMTIASIPAYALLRAGECTAACLLAREPGGVCACRCGGEFHGALISTAVPVPDPADRFAWQQIASLEVLPQCGRCEGDRDEKCLDAGWDISDQQPVTWAAAAGRAGSSMPRSRTAPAGKRNLSEHGTTCPLVTDRVRSSAVPGNAVSRGQRHDFGIRAEAPPAGHHTDPRWSHLRLCRLGG